MHKNVCMARAMPIVFCCYLVDLFFFKDSQLYCLEHLCRLKKKKKKMFGVRFVNAILL